MKPNTQKQADSFDSQQIFNQIKYLSVNRAVSVRKAGFLTQSRYLIHRFPIRKTYVDFLRHYKPIFWMKNKNSKMEVIFLLSIVIRGFTTHSKETGDSRGYKEALP